MHPVATWWLHDITKLPICWLFGEFDKGGNYEYKGDPDREAMYCAFVYDGATCRYYEGTLSDGLLHLDQVHAYVRRYTRKEERRAELEFTPGKESGAEIVIIEDGLHTGTWDIDSGNTYISTYTWCCRSRDMIRVEGLRAAIEDYRIEIGPDSLNVSRRDSPKSS